MLPVILASTSDTRILLLHRLMDQVQQTAPHCDETPLVGEKPLELALRLARMKAQSLAKQYPHHLIIGSDQVATLDGASLIGKPLTYEGAIAQLQQASGRTQTFYTSVCLLNTHTGTAQSDVVETQVQFRDLSVDSIAAYVAKEDVRFCAGSFKAEGAGIGLFRQIISTDPTALLGLPLIRLVDFLQKEGVALYR